MNSGSPTANASSANYPINITITNTDATANITRVNLTLYGFTFISGSNSTSAGSNVFSNISTNLIWTNTTSTGFIENGTSQSFMFNVSVTTIPNNYNITVIVTDTAGIQNSTNLIYTVILHNITFLNLTAMTNTTATNNNVTYLINITNTGSATHTYTLSVVNCSNVSQAGVGTLNVTSVSLAAGASAAVQLTVSNSTPGNYLSCINASLSADGALWNFTSSKDAVILNSTFYFQDLNATAMSFTNSTGGQHLLVGNNITVTTTLRNSGTQNFTGSIVISYYWDGAFVGNQSIAYTSLPNEVPNSTIFNITYGNVTTPGSHSVTVFVDSSNNVIESNESNNYTSSALVGYNVTILSVVGYSNVTQTALNATPASNVTLNVSVKYWNGDPVSGLIATNFTVYDNYSGSATLTSIGGFSAYTGYYTFNISAPSITDITDTKPGVHNLYAYASESPSSGNSSYYYLVVPKITVTVTPQDHNPVNESHSQTIIVSINNSGSDLFYSVTITGKSTANGIFGLTYGTTSCASNVSASSMVNCTITNVRSGDISGNQIDYITVTITGYYPYAGTAYNASGTTDLTAVDITVAAADDDTGGGGGGTPERSCTSDASCINTEYCNALKKCAAVSCPGGQVVKHVCIGGSNASTLSITSFGSSLSAVSGGSNSTQVTVKNLANSTAIVKLAVTINNVTPTVSPVSYSLDGGESFPFTVNFSVPNSTTIGQFSGTFKAYVSSNTAVYDSETFTFKVLPKEETKANINSSYQQLSIMLGNISVQLSQMKASGRYNESVLSTLESLISAANTTLNQARGAMDSNDYSSAQNLVTQATASITTAQSEISGAQTQVPGTGTPLDQGPWLWVAIGVILIFVVGFFIYMFYPSGGQKNGYRPEGGYVHPQAAAGQGVFAKIKGIFKRKKSQPAASPISSFAQPAEQAEQHADDRHYDTFHYSEGYKKERSGESEKKGFFQRFKKKKEDKGPQKHIDQFGNQAANP